MRITEYPAHFAVDDQKKTERAPAGLIASRLIDTASASSRSRVYVALSEGRGRQIVAAVHCLDPSSACIVLPPWDCLPYDRVPPSRQSMGQRMDALRVWSEPSEAPRLMVTSLDALLQRVPPQQVIRCSRFTLSVGKPFNRKAFEQFALQTGYVHDGLVDEPGELAFRDEVIDIFPAGATAPMRIALAEDGTVAELRSYDPVTQRTTSTVEEMVFGPASEAIVSSDGLDPASPPPAVSERCLFRLYGSLQPIFESLGDVEIALETGSCDRLSRYLDIIDDARLARRRFGGNNGDDGIGDHGHSLYLQRSEWTESVERLERFELALFGSNPTPQFSTSPNPRKAFIDFAAAEHQAGRSVLLVGEGRAYERFVRRVERETGREFLAIGAWAERHVQPTRTLLKLAGALDEGFADAEVTVVTMSDILGVSVDRADIATVLSEPDLRLGDVVVHEDHGIGILKILEPVAVDGAVRDTARIEYRDGASLLVPMEDFGKLWRYGSEPEAVTLDRLHTDAWQNRRADIEKDIRSAARHLLQLAKERHDGKAAVFVPPRNPYATFTNRFPYATTAHQAAAVNHVLEDLASGNVMNRLICGDVGFGKTEVALRAAAAVALAGGQVAVIAPTTVLARQHFLNFERRFRDMDIRVAMLSRVVPASTAKDIKARLVSGAIDIVIGTQALLSKTVSFDRLGLLVIDEEHRFGAREKQAMKALAPDLHTLIMSATPIPRTLQSALIGVQDVSLLTVAPSKRRPVRTSIIAADRAAMRIALRRERLRGGQTFVVVPRIEDIAPVESMLKEVVPELHLRVAHGKMKADTMDEIMVGFADGDGDVLLSTNIIESGLDVPRANTIIIWRADRFGLAQLHQLRGRVGRGNAQGMAYLLTEEGQLVSEESRLRLSSLVENDRLGSGLALSLRDLDLRGAGDVAGDDQAGHMRLIGVSLYQRLLARTLAAGGRSTKPDRKTAEIALGIAGTIPQDYVADATVRVNLYARLLRAETESDIDGFFEEFDDRFGEPPDAVLTLFRLAKLRLRATAFGLSRLDAGPDGLAITFSSTPTRKTLAPFLRDGSAKVKENRLLFRLATKNALERIVFFEALFDEAARHMTAVRRRQPMP